MHAYHEPARDIPITRDADVIIAGGGPAGLAAAIAAARNGARTVLLERFGYLGGTAAALCCREGVSPRRLDVARLQGILAAQGAVARR